MGGPAELNIAEIAGDDGRIRFRFGRYLSKDGTRWIRHGLFQAFHTNGKLASEGNYVHGFEEGVWRDYHENGRPASEGSYVHGKKQGTWLYWDDNGRAEANEEFLDGLQVTGRA